MDSENLVLSKTEQKLLECLQSLDNQVSRELQRSPAELDAQGVQKWEPYQRRIERLTSIFLQALGEQAIDLDSLLILSQSTTKVLRFIAEDMGEEGLGKMRSAYCISAFQSIRDDCRRALEPLQSSRAN